MLTWPYTGALAMGLVWGWLGHHVVLPTRRRVVSLGAVLSLTAAAAAFQTWPSDRWAALAFALAALAGALGYGAWRDGLRRQASLLPSNRERS